MSTRNTITLIMASNNQAKVTQSSATMQTVRLKFLLLGKTGQGKSSTGNTLLSSNVFEKSSYSESKTKDVKAEYGIFKNYILKVVDGPGLSDNARTQVEDRETFAKCMTTAIAMCSGGVDAFILTLRFPFRFTAEETLAVNSLKGVFGEQFMNHVIVIVTCGDMFCLEFEENTMSFTDWCERQGGDFRNLYNDCNRRVVLFNNKEKDANKMETQIQEVVQLAHNLQQKSGQYTCKFFEDANEQREKLILELKAPHLRSEFQEKIALLKASIDKYCTTKADGDKEMTKVLIKNLKQELNTENKYGILDDLRDLLNRIEGNLNDVETLHRLNSQLESIRQARSFWAAIGLTCASISTAVLSAAFPVAIACAVASGVITLIGCATFCVDEIKTEKKINELEKKRKCQQQQGHQ